MSRNTDNTCGLSLGSIHPSVSLEHKVGLWTRLDPRCRDYSWRWDVEIHFTRSCCWTGVFQNLNIWSTQIHHTRWWCVSPKDQRSNPAEIRTRQNNAYKGGRTEISPIPVGKSEWKYLKPQVSCRWFLNILTPFELGRP